MDRFNIDKSREEFSYISEIRPRANHAGYKARIDVEKILSDRYKDVICTVQIQYFSSILSRIQCILNPRNIFRFFCLIRIRGHRVFVQYPFELNKIERALLVGLMKNNEVFLLVHDINTIRDLGAIPEEFTILNKAKALIVHNEKMKDYLKQKGINAPMISLEIFDYLLSEKPKAQTPFYGKEIIFAGNLSKSEFLQNPDVLTLGFEWNLYGPMNERLVQGQQIHYLGSFNPNNLDSVKGSFGLVWDGKSVDTCNGLMGEYQRYNNPHKLSMYLAAGFPVIVWEKAAIADFVLRENVGIVVESLSGISKVIDELGTKGYEKLTRNVKRIQVRLMQGYYTNRALDAVENLLTSKENA